MNNWSLECIQGLLTGMLKAPRSEVRQDSPQEMCYMNCQSPWYIGKGNQRILPNPLMVVERYIIS